jgi:hypothetical protein
VIPYKYNEFKTKLLLDKVEDGKIYITYEMVVEGSVEEYIWNKQLLDPNILSALQSNIEKTIEERSKTVIDKFQKEFKVDLIGIKSYLEKYKPSIYKSIEKDYESFFTNNIVINIKPKVSVRRVGTVE